MRWDGLSTPDRRPSHPFQIGRAWWFHAHASLSPFLPFIRAPCRMGNHEGEGSLSLPRIVSYAPAETEEETTEKPSSPPPPHVPNAEERASFLSRHFYTFFSRMVALGYRRPLEMTDLDPLAVKDSVDVLYRQFVPAWEQEKTCSPESPSLYRALRHIFLNQFLLGSFLYLLWAVMQFSSPILTSELVKGVEQGADASVTRMYIVAALFFVLPFLQTMMIQTSAHVMFRMGMRVRVLILAAVYRKALRISSKGRQQSTTGEMVNLMANDAQRIQEFTAALNFLWGSLLQIILSLLLLAREMELGVLAAIGVLIVVIPINTVIGKLFVSIRKKNVMVMDQRVKLINETLQGIRVIKLYGWEPSIVERIMALRKKEMGCLWKFQITRAFIILLLNAVPALIALGVFTTYTSLGNTLTVPKVYASIAIFNLLRMPLILFPMIMSYFATAKVGIRRIANFLQLDELDANDVEHVPSCHEPFVHVDECAFSWSNDAERPTLDKVSFRAGPGELLMVIGAVGCGKSTLISGLIGDVKKMRGSVRIGGRVAYVPQTAFIFNDTLRSNVLFGTDMEEERYAEALRVCALDQDIAVLPGGEETEIGEKGINLSGGQKQRVSLARAVYSDADVYILDDPLSAVDAHVGRHIFDECIMGSLRNKLRIFITNQLQYLSFADEILVLKDGQIANRGSYEQLLEQGIDFSSLIDTHKKPGQTKNGQENKKNDEEKKTLLDQPQPVKEEVRHGKSPPNDKGSLVKVEESATGTIKREVLKAYISGAGLWVIVAVFFALIIEQSTRILADTWAGWWANDKFDRQNVFYIGIYGAWVFGNAFAVFARSALLATLTLGAATVLHDRCINRVVQSPTSFFDTTPIGRLLNRFSADMQQIDMVLPMSIETFLHTSAAIVAIIIVISLVWPYLLIGFLVIIYLFFLLQQYYRRTARELQRLESVRRSPIFTNFSQTLMGLSVIRAYGEEERFIHMHDTAVNENARVYWTTQIANRWLGVRLEFLGIIIVFVTALFIVVNRESIAEEVAGLAIVYALIIIFTLNMNVRMLTDTEAKMNAVERLVDYANVPQEASAIVEDHRPPDNWPDDGAVSFCKIAMRYREGLELILKGISFDVRPREKVGIVGRTGSGKSSVMNALFRLVEPTSGEIIIDDVNVMQIGLRDLRTHLAIIPQDPVMFSGTIRFNLDPFNKYTDDEVWTALEQVQMKSVVVQLPEQLESEVVEGGQNFSVGQRQLVCLARCILRRPKILLMDEATASVDLDTDTLIQKTVRVQFRDSTILTIAHRLNTIMDSDRVMVMDDGNVVEFDTPRELLRCRDGKFTHMVEQTGERSAAHLRRIAFGETDIFELSEVSSPAVSRRSSFTEESDEK